jgi:hypothetical protein
MYKNDLLCRTAGALKTSGQARTVNWKQASPMQGGGGGETPYALAFFTPLVVFASRFGAGQRP